MEPIKVLHIAPKMSSGGGIENTIMNYYRNINHNYVQFDFLVHSKDVTNFDKEIEMLGGKIHRVTHYHENIIKNIIETLKVFRQNDEYDIIHIHTSSGIKLLDGLIARICRKKHIIFHSHSYFPTKKLTYKITTIFFRIIGTDFLACSQQAGKFFFGEKIVNSSKFKVINNAIDIERYMFNKEVRFKVKRNLEIQDKFVIGHVGRFTHEKNHEFILKVFKKIHKKNNKSVLILVGEGPLKEEIQIIAEDMGIKDSVIFTGVRSDVNELLQGMDIFIFPSKYEGLGMALIEAQAVGLYCVTSDNVIRETDLTGNVKYLSLEKSPEFWAEEILNNIKYLKRENKYDAISSAGYNLKKEAKHLENYYINLIN